MTGLPVPIPASVVPGAYDTAALWNANVYNGLTFLLNPPLFVGVQTVAQSLATSTWTACTLDTAPVDTYGGHSLTTNTSRYTAQVAGWYLCAGAVCIANNATGPRGARLHLNGSPVQGAAAFIPTGAGVDMGIPTATRIIRMNAGDYVEVAAYQNSGGTLNTAVYSDIACALTVQWCHA